MMKLVLRHISQEAYTQQGLQIHLKYLNNYRDSRNFSFNKVT